MLVALAVFGLVSGVNAQTQDRAIRIVSGSYGQNCGAPHGNATRDVSRQCDGHTICQYAPGAKREASRVAATCKRDFVAEWRCDDADFHTASLSAGTTGGDTLVMSCVIERGAGK